MKRAHLDKLNQVAGGLIRDVPKSTLWGQGYHAGVRQMQTAIQLIAAGKAGTTSNLTHNVKKIGMNKPTRERLKIFNPPTLDDVEDSRDNSGGPRK